MKDVWEAVLNHSRHKGNELLMMLILADYADEHGFCWPGLDAIAEKSRMSPRNASRIIGNLEESGELIVMANMGARTPTGRTNAYLVCIEGIKTSIPAWAIADRLEDMNMRKGMPELSTLDDRVDETDHPSDSQKDSIVTPSMSELSTLNGQGASELSPKPSYKTEPSEEKDKSANTAPARPLIDFSSDVAQVMALFEKNPRQPDIKEVEAELEKHPLENILTALRKNKNRPGVVNLWAYSKPAFGDELKAPPSSGQSPPNGNGKKPYNPSPEEQAAYEKHAAAAKRYLETQKKASGES